MSKYRRWAIHVAILGLVLTIILTAALSDRDEKDKQIHDEATAHDCSGWNPSDPTCDGGTNTILLLFGVVIGGGAGYTLYRRRNEPDWPFN